jgi:N6-L-threonylcarbamoyladenine synthase
LQLLALETSCDETAAAVVRETGDPARPWAAASNIVASQTAIHRGWGGVVPELASRQHVRDICGVVEAALAEAGITIADLGAVAVTQGPGLVGSLLVGVSFAKALGWARALPVIPVHHLAGHIESLTLAHGELPLPAAVLVVSGGHTSLYHVPKAGLYQLVGRTRDDAAGEAYDKVAKLLGLGYPGGPAIDQIAREGRDDAFEFPAARLTHADRNSPEPTAPPGLLPADAARRVDFSFSGLKTAVLRLVRERTGMPVAGTPARGSRVGARVKAGSAGAVGATLSRQEVADICASFQRVVVEALLDRTFEAAGWLRARSVGIAGGVSANSRLRADADARGARHGLPVYVPPIALSTDNAAMIGAAGFRRMRVGPPVDLTFNAEASLPLW